MPNHNPKAFYDTSRNFQLFTAPSTLPSVKSIFLQYAYLGRLLFKFPFFLTYSNMLTI